MAEPHRRWVDELLRPVLPVGDGAPPSARQLLPETLGWEEVSEVAGLYAVQAVVDRTDRSTAPSVRPVAMGPLLLTDRRDEKSPVKGDFHAGIRGSRGVRFPPATRPRSPAAVPRRCP